MDEAEVWRSLAGSLAVGWTAYWRQRAISPGELRSDLEQTRSTKTPPLYMKCSDQGVALVSAFRRVAGLVEDAGAGAVAAMSLAAELGDQLMLYGLLSAAPESEGFAWFHGQQPDRSHMEAFAKMSGAADWCAAMGRPLVGAGATVLRLAPDEVPAPAAWSPQMFGVAARMSLCTQQWTASADHAPIYRRVAGLLPEALRMRDTFVLPTVASGARPTVERRGEVIGPAVTSLLTAQLAAAAIRGAAAQAIAPEPGDDPVAVSLLRLLSQDVLMVALSRPARYPTLPLLDPAEIDDLMTVEADIPAWIAKHGGS